jgi:hypothetical protein
LLYLIFSQFDIFCYFTFLSFYLYIYSFLTIWMQDGFHLVEDTIANYDDHRLLLFLLMLKMLFIMYVVLKLIWPMWILLKIFFIMFLLILLWLLSRKKAMSKASVSTYKYNVVHVLDPSRLGGTIVDFKDSFGMLCLKRNFQSTKTNFQCNFSLTYTWNNECQYNFWPCF